MSTCISVSCTDLTVILVGDKLLGQSLFSPAAVVVLNYLVYMDDKSAHSCKPLF